MEGASVVAYEVRTGEALTYIARLRAELGSAETGIRTSQENAARRVRCLPVWQEKADFLRSITELSTTKLPTVLLATHVGQRTNNACRASRKAGVEERASSVFRRGKQVA